MKREHVPRLLVLGGPSRAASTSLFELLAAHPSVLPGAEKECRFYLPEHVPLPSAARYPAPRAEFLASFPRSTSARWWLDATPDYLHHPRSAERIAAHFPGARVVFLLRDPVERFLSWYRYARQRDQPEARRGLAGFFEAQLEARCAPSAPSHLLARDHGDYGPGLERFLAVFGRGQVWVGFFERLRDDPAGLVAALGSFLELELDPATLRARHRAAEVRSAWLAGRERALKRWSREHVTAPWLRRGLAPLRRALGGVYRRWNTIELAPAPRPDPDEVAVIAELQRHYAPAVERVAQLLGERPPWPRWGAVQAGTGTGLARAARS